VPGGSRGRQLPLDFGVAQRDDGTDRFHWINEGNLLDTNDLNAIATFVCDERAEGDTRDDGP
jgi:hypothetical protein